MKHLKISFLLLGAMVCGAGISAASSIYGIYSETYNGVSIECSDNCEGDPAIVGGSSFVDSPVSFEGSHAVRLGGTGRFYVILNSPKDLRNYHYITFDYMVPSGGTIDEVSISLKDNLNVETLGSPLYNLNTGGNWYRAKVAMSAFETPGSPTVYRDQTRVPFIFTISRNTSNSVIYIDNVLYHTSIESAYAGQVDAYPATGGFGAVVYNVSNDQPASNQQITWSGVSPGITKWKQADQYIRITYDYWDNFEYFLNYDGTLRPAKNMGIAIYTDNLRKILTSIPNYFKELGRMNNPSGLLNIDLVNAYNTGQTQLAPPPPLPMAWRIVDKVGANAAYRNMVIRQGREAGTCMVNDENGDPVPSPYDPDLLWTDDSGACYPVLFYMMDYSIRDADTVNSGDQGLFHDNYIHSFAVPWRFKGGIQHGHEDSDGAHFPNDILLAADFSQAVAKRKYQVDSLIVELFSE